MFPSTLHREREGSLCKSFERVL